MNNEEKQMNIVKKLRSDLDNWSKKAHKLRLKYEHMYEKKYDPLLNRYCIEKKKLALINILQHPKEYLKSEEERLKKEIKSSEAILK